MSNEETAITNNYERTDKINYYKKMNALRAAVNKCDWAKDARMMAAGMSYSYLTAGKIRRNLAPLLVSVGLEMDISLEQPVQLAPLGQKGLQHWLIPIKAQFTDIDTGYSGPVLCGYGEGADTLDKGLRKAITAGIKSIFSDKFNIEDGIDPEATEGGEYSAPKDDTEVKSKIFNMAEKVPAPKPKVPAPKTPAPKVPEVKKETVKEEPKAEEPKEEPKAEAPKEEANVPAYEPPKEKIDAAAFYEEQKNPELHVIGAQEKTLKKKFTEWCNAYNEGEVSNTSFREFVAVFRNVLTAKEAMSFIVKFHKVE